MFSTNPNYTKLKTHLRLSVNRLKLLEKKKTELAQKARREIAEYIAAGKSERAKIRVEHIIRKHNCVRIAFEKCYSELVFVDINKMLLMMYLKSDCGYRKKKKLIADHKEDYMVEAMEIVEMYCDLVLARFGLVTQMKELDEGLAEAISTLIWVAPRMHTDVQELKVISDLLTAKYGKIYADACRNESVNTISEKLKHKLSVQSPPKILIEKYLIEIAKNYNVEYTPDEQVMREEEARDAMLIDINGPPMPPGFIGFPQLPSMPNMPPPPVQPFSYPSGPSGGKAGGFMATPPGPPAGYSLPPGVDSKDLSNSFLQEEMHNLPPAYDSINHDLPAHVPTPHAPPPRVTPTPQPRARAPAAHFPELPELPSVPSDILLPSVPNSDASSAHQPDASAPDEIDFEDLNRRFEELKKKK